MVFGLNKYIVVMFDGTNINAKFEGKLTCAFENNMKNLTNFCSQAEK